MFKRILEADKIHPEDKEQTPPKLSISGVDISSIGLKILREKIVLIPQDPFLLEGTIKFNLDPFNKFTNETVLEVLKKTRVYESLVSTITRKADAPHETNNKGQKLLEESERLKILAPTNSEVKSEDILNFQLESGGGNLSLGQR